MELITRIIDLTKKIYEVDVSNNLDNNITGLIFLSNDYFDWFAEGVFIYQPDLEGEEGVEYTKISPSTLYEYDDSNESAFIYIRSDYHRLLSQYYLHYIVID